MAKKIKSFDRIYIGLIIGIFIPVLAFLIYYLLKFREIKLTTYIETVHYYKILFKILSLCVLTDLGIFYIFINTKRFNGAKGVVMACIFYALSVLIYRIMS